MAVGELHERVRKAVVTRRGERAEQLGRRRLVHVEAEGASGSEAVGEQDAVALHLMFGVMRHGALGADRHRGNHLRIGGRLTTNVDHGQKVGAKRIGIARPDVQE